MMAISQHKKFLRGVLKLTALCKHDVICVIRPVNIVCIFDSGYIRWLIYMIGMIES